MMETSSLSHARAVTLLKDAIHDCITLTCFEREIVDHEQFQRLHSVLQNSTTYIAFPNNKNSRFCHSIGVCHVVGRLFNCSLRNATPQDLQSFLNEAAKLIHAISVKGNDGAAKRLRSAWKQTISGHSGFRHRPSLRTEDTREPLESLSLNEPKYPFEETGENRKFTAGFLVDTLWQAIRVCGLVHDIGHLPMSHSLEGALDKFLSSIKKDVEDGRLEIPEQFGNVGQLIAEVTSEENYNAVFTEFSGVIEAAYNHQPDQEALRVAMSGFPIHEKRSLLVLDHMYRTGIYEFEGDLREYRAVIYKLAFLVLFSSIRADDEHLEDEVEKENGKALVNNTAFRFLKLIVAGSIDGDRLDYTIRDGYSSGTQIGRYGLEEIIESSTLFRDRTNNTFKLGYFYRCLPEIENFFAQRHLGYKNIIYHRTSSRAEVCLQYATSLLLQYCVRETSDPISSFFASLGFIDSETGSVSRVYPVEVNKNVEYSGESIDAHVIPSIEDAKFRSFLSWTLDEISKRQTAGRLPKNSILNEINLLLRIVLNREFYHIYDPFKDVSRSRLAERLFSSSFFEDGLFPSDLTEEEKGKYVSERYALSRELFATNKHFRNEILEAANGAIRSALPTGILMLETTQAPKIYDHDFAKDKGEEVYLVFNGADEDGFLPVKPIPECSAYLREMKNIYPLEFRVCNYFVFENLKKKKNDKLIRDIDSAVNLGFECGTRKAVRLLNNQYIEGN